MQPSQRKHPLIIIGIVTFFLIVAILYTVNYFSSSRTVSIHAIHIKSLTLTNPEKNGDKGKTYAATAKTIRVKKDTTYQLTYAGADGYTDGGVAITPETKTITITPDYSAEKLQSMLSAELSTIQGVIRAAYPTVDQVYTLNTGSLSHYGEWYFTTLTYKGSADDESSDTLVLGMQQSSGEWKLTLTPNIVFTTHDYPGVSRVFINAANQYRIDHVTTSTTE